MALAALLLWLAPAEQTLGSGITSVYVHVALTWTGMTGLIIAAVLGLAPIIHISSWRVDGAVAVAVRWAKWRATTDVVSPHVTRRR